MNTHVIITMPDGAKRDACYIRLTGWIMAILIFVSMSVMSCDLSKDMPQPPSPNITISN
jgi:hypothetical protein